MLVIITRTELIHNSTMMCQCSIYRNNVLVELEAELELKVASLSLKEYIRMSMSMYFNTSLVELWYYRIRKRHKFYL